MRRAAGATFFLCDILASHRRADDLHGSGPYWYYRTGTSVSQQHQSWTSQASEPQPAQPTLSVHLLSAAHARSETSGGRATVRQSGRQATDRPAGSRASWLKTRNSDEQALSARSLLAAAYSSASQPCSTICRLAAPSRTPPM